MTHGGSTARTYARALEHAIEQRLGRPAILSPRDWALLSDWFERGVPLELVIEALDEVARRRGRHGGGSRRLGLGLLVPAVEEAHRAWIEGRATVPENAESPLPSRETVRKAWSEAAATSGPGSALEHAIGAAIEILDRGGSPEEADGALDAALIEVAPESLREAASAAALRALSPFRRRMDGEAFEATRRRGVADRLRRALGLPRITLTR